MELIAAKIFDIQHFFIYRLPLPYLVCRLPLDWGHHCGGHNRAPVGIRRAYYDHLYAPQILA